MDFSDFVSTDMKNYIIINIFLLLSFNCSKFIEHEISIYMLKAVVPEQYHMALRYC